MTYSNTTNNAPAAPLDVEKILAECRKLMEAPRLVGDLMGCPVYVSGRVPDNVVEIHMPGEVLRFSIDHPYIQGTKLERDVRAFVSGELTQEAK